MKIGNFLIDILFGNEDELLSLSQSSDFNGALNHIASKVETLAATRGPAGSVAVRGGETASVAAIRVGDVIDTTGAGDLYAAGFLHGVAASRDLEACARLGGLAAAEVISHYGARPEQSLAELARAHGL